MRNFAPFLCLTAALLCAAPVRAADPDLPAIDPLGQGRVMTHDDATTTSKCVGNPITPLCAVETVIACFARNDDEFCRIGMGLDRPPEFVRSQPFSSSVHYDRYRVLAAKQFTEQNLPPPRQLSLSGTPPDWWYTEDRRRYRPGDVQIVVLKQHCRRNPEKCNRISTSDRYNYHLRRIGDRWTVLIWSTPDPRIEKIRPEKF